MLYTLVGCQSKHNYSPENMFVCFAIPEEGGNANLCWLMIGKPWLFWVVDMMLEAPKWIPSDFEVGSGSAKWF